MKISRRGRNVSDATGNDLIFDSREKLFMGSKILTVDGVSGSAEHSYVVYHGLIFTPAVIGYVSYSGEAHITDHFIKSGSTTCQVRVYPVTLSSATIVVTPGAGFPSDFKFKVSLYFSTNEIPI